MTPFFHGISLSYRVFSGCNKEKVDLIIKYQYTVCMTTFSFTHAQNNFAKVLDAADQEPILVTRSGKEPFVIMSSGEYNSIQETLHLMSSPKNVSRLQESLEDYKAGNLISKELIEGWNLIKILRICAFFAVVKKKSRLGIWNVREENVRNRLETFSTKFAPFAVVKNPLIISLVDKNWDKFIA